MICWVRHLAFYHLKINQWLSAIRSFQWFSWPDSPQAAAFSRTRLQKKFLNKLACLLIHSERIADKPQRHGMPHSPVSG